MSDINATDFDSLTEEENMMACEDFSGAIRQIDKQFGNGFAQTNPQLTGMLLLASAIERTGAIIAQQIRSGFSDVASEVSLTTFPDVSDELRGLVDGMESIAHVIEYK